MGMKRWLVVGLVLWVGACARDADEGAPVVESTTSTTAEKTTSPPTTSDGTETAGEPSKVVLDASGRRVCDRAWAEGAVMASGDRYLHEQLFDAVEYIGDQAFLSERAVFFVDSVTELTLGAADATESGDITAYGLAMVDLIDACQEGTDWTPR